MSTFRKVLEDRLTQEVHYQPKRTFMPIIGEHGAFQADLLFLDQYAAQNKGYHGILTLVNIPTRYGYAVPFKGKNDTLHAFKAFMAEARKNKQDVVRLETDQGSEFVNRAFHAYLASEGIKHTTALPGDHRKQGIIERFNQTLRGWIERWLTEKKVNNWIDVMPEILEYYNTRTHKTTGMAPADMTEEDEEDLISEQYEATQGARDGINAIKPGDRVRVIVHKKAFGKGRLRWSDNVYTIESRVPESYSFKLVETDVPQKYSDVQVVTNESRDVRPKAKETQALAADRAHALRFARSGLARGVGEAQEVMRGARAPEVEVGPRRNPGRERIVPARFRDDSVVGPGEPRSVPSRPEARVEKVVAKDTGVDVEPRRGTRMRTAPAWQRDYTT